MNAYRFVFRLGLVATLLASPSWAEAQAPAQWNRYPAISPDGSTIVFTYRGDLYRVPTSGGQAEALTSHVAHDFMPVWSRDGQTLAFASDRHGNYDIYTMPASGGSARRITFHSAPEYPYAFDSSGGAVLFASAQLDAASNRMFPTGSQPELYSVPITGGRVTQVLTTPAEGVFLT